jgi:UDPglucose--hexose-1-phosphate uridylyltransferase
MGCSNPHPHGQVWSLSEIPSFPATELENLRKYSLQAPDPGNSSSTPKGPNNRPCLLCEYVHYEVSVPQDGRVVLMDDHWVALVPYWAVWPFEILRTRNRSGLIPITQLGH